MNLNKFGKFLIVALSLVILGLVVFTSFLFFAAAIVIWPLYLAFKEQKFKFPNFKKASTPNGIVDAEFSRVE